MKRDALLVMAIHWNYLEENWFKNVGKSKDAVPSLIVIQALSRNYYVSSLFEKGKSLI